MGEWSVELDMEDSAVEALDMEGSVVELDNVGTMDSHRLPDVVDMTADESLSYVHVRYVSSTHVWSYS